MTSGRICPQPQAWDLVRSALEKARAELAPQAPKVPVPLILGAWHYTTDADKGLRWEETLRWADTHGLRHRVPEIGDHDWYSAS